MKLQLSALLVLATLAGCKPATAPSPALAHSALQSPWDLRKVAPTETEYVCGQPLELAPDIALINKNYDPDSPQAAAEMTNTVYVQSSAAIADLSARLARAADAYQQMGSLPAAVCVGTLLSAAASDHAMAGWMFSRDAVYEQTKGLRSVAVAYLKVRNSGVIPPQNGQYILSWLEDIAHAQRSFYDTRRCRKERCDLYNHRAASAAYAVASVGIAANDRGDFGWGIHRYRSIVSRIDPSGMLRPDFVWRWTLRNHIESAASLVQVAEYGELNGESLYAYDGGAINLLVHTTTQALVDPSQFVLRAHAKQSMPKKIEGWEIGWATIYVRRFPDDLISSLLAKSTDAGFYAWGGEPFGTEPDN